MITKTFEFEDYDGNMRKEEHCFHLTKAELLDMEMSTEGGLEKTINKLIMTQDNVKIMEIFKKLIYDSYGVKSDDGRRFIKKKEVKDAFMETEAYSMLIMELISDPDKANKFILGIMPKDIDTSAVSKNAEARLKGLDLEVLPGGMTETTE